MHRGVCEIGAHAGSDERVRGEKERQRESDRERETAAVRNTQTVLGDRVVALSADRKMAGHT
jgi:hypothetical protein